MSIEQGILNQIEGIIGYEFKDKDLLVAAFTHSSYANSHQTDSNEKLEFLGDSVLNLVVTSLLYDGHSPTEGEMTVTRSKIVSRRPLAAEVERLDIIKYLRLRNVKDEELSEKFYSDLYEAVIGAIYKDGGLAEASKFIKRTLLSHMEKMQISDYKTALQERCQALKLKLEYNDETLREVPSLFKSAAVISGVVQGEGKGVRKKEAQQAAAKKAYTYICSIYGN